MCLNGKVKLITTMHETQTLYDVVVNGVWFLKPTVPTFPKNACLRNRICTSYTIMLQATKAVTTC